MAVAGGGDGDCVTVQLDGGVRLRRNAMDTDEMDEADRAFGRTTSTEYVADIRCRSGGVTRPYIMSIKEDWYR